jgi:hypothetical protein
VSLKKWRKSAYSLSPRNSPDSLPGPLRSVLFILILSPYMHLDLRTISSHEIIQPKNIVRISCFRVLVPRPSHPFCFYRPTNIWRSVQVMKLLILQPPTTFFLLGPNVLSTLFSNSQFVCLNVRNQVSHPYKATYSIICSFILQVKTRLLYHNIWVFLSLFVLKPFEPSDEFS